MSKEQQTDRIIRNKLRYHPSASPNHLWKAIDAQLGEDNKQRRGGFWWITGGVAAILLLGAGLFLWQHLMTSTVPPSVVSSSTANKEIPTVSNNNATNNTAAIPNAASTSDEQTDKQQASLNSHSSNRPTSGPGNNSGTTDFNSLVSSEEVTPVEKSTSAPAFAEKHSSPVEEEALTGLSDNQNTSKKIEEGQLVLLAPTEAVAKREAETMTSLHLPSTAAPILDNTEPTLDWPTFLVEPKCATFGKWLKLYFYGDMYFSPDVAFRKLESKGADYEDYTASREATESQSFSYSAGARFSVVSNYGIALRTGLVYSQINEIFDYENEREERIFIENHYDDDGNLIRTDTIIETGTRYLTTYNHYRMWDIPVLLGYELNFKKFTLALNGGVYLNLISRQKGNFLSPDLVPVTFTSDQENTYPAFKEKLNMSLYGSLAFYYNLNERWQIMLEPQLRYYLDPMTRPDYMVDQQYITTGLNTGLRYRF